MHFAIVKLNDNKYQVINKDTGKIYSKETTKIKAIKLIKSMECFDDGNDWYCI